VPVFLSDELFHECRVDFRGNEHFNLQ